MAKTKETKKLDTSTEEKIKEAARTVFYKKGFAATRTRDIAEEADINLALLNYYFRSKAKLFEIIILEALSGFIQSIRIVLNDERTTLETKTEELAGRYIDLIIREPEIPTFIIAEMRNNPKELLHKLPLKDTLLNSVFFRQHTEAVKKGRITEPNPFHFFMNLMGLIIFPFIGKPMIMEVSGLQNAAFNQMMLERKRLIPIWIKSMMKAE
ncbi:TetR/AcrR family transcriptional regulator [Chryseobacterium sp. Tr-659]|uniref:TetR/AcrR family transcriptional regulator n=1 Tax=Chryseobacterium sp. Tr-659 TaxID=2608340 RepID=UPI0014223031|nr:TetR family transcriptional regulator [Chryseobacterium sp. Tr-659]NIF06142.1 TetR/AcrR family transcriptional regulator [Chryseobacterium sp. Tr-659]